jgi:TorA maturation chaperone TorD
MSTPMQFVPTLPPEEAARANFYGVLARLFAAPPDAALLKALAAAGGLAAEDDALAGPWNELARAAAAADAEAVREEYETAFVGVGKAPVTLYVSAYSVRFTNESPLVALRGELAALGLSRRSETNEPEDHVAALCEVMRLLIAEEKVNLEVQRRFFQRWIWPIVQPLCSAIESSELTAFYRTVSRLFSGLCTLEHRAFEML